MDEDFWSWFAGFWEGEGSVGIYRYNSEQEVAFMFVFKYHKVTEYRLITLLHNSVSLGASKLV